MRVLVAKSGIDAAMAGSTKRMGKLSLVHPPTAKLSAEEVQARRPGDSDESFWAALSVACQREPKEETRLTPGLPLRKRGAVSPKHWVKVASNLDLGAYEMFQAAGHYPDPEWPADLAFDDLRQARFQRSCHT